MKRCESSSRPSDAAAGARVGGAIRRLSRVGGPVAAIFALLAAAEMLLMAPREDLLSVRVWWAVLLTHGVVALGVVVVALVADAVWGILSRSGVVRREGRTTGDWGAREGGPSDWGLSDWGLSDWGLALTALVAGFSHGWPVVKGPLEEALGRPLALGALVVVVVCCFWLLRRRPGMRSWQLVLPMVCAFAAALGYYLLRARPLGLAAHPLPASLTGISLFVLLVVVLIGRAQRRRNASLIALLFSMVFWVRLSAPAPHAPVVGEAEAAPTSGAAPAVRAPVLLIVIDTLRADALDLDGGAAGRTPHLARLAAESDVFTRAVANASWTLPTHASLFTGLRVSRHRVDMTSADGYGSRLDASLPTLHERLAGWGYATSCITANGIVGPASGLTRGCARYRHPGRAWTLQTAPLRLWYALTPSARPALEEQLMTQTTGLRRHATAGEVLGFALEELAEAREPAYLFLNLMDVHKPYPAAPEISTGKNISVLLDLMGVLVGLRDPEEFDRRHAEWARRSYLAQVSRLDDALGAFFAELREGGLYEEALIVVTADHGEAFFENPDLPLYYDHHGAYEPAVRIPLIVKRPGGQAGRRFGHLVEQAEIAPTVLALAAEGPGSEDPGSDDPGSEGLFDADSEAIALTEWNPHPIPGAMSTLPVQRIGLYRDGYKLVLEGDWRGAPRTRLFDLERGPFEGFEVSAGDPGPAEALRSELLEILGREWASGAALGSGEEEPDPELLETLRSLGYIE